MDPRDWIRDTRQYFVEVQTEWKKITWPAQSEAMTGTVSVVVVVAIVTTVLAIIDYGLSQLMRVVLQ